MGMFDTPEEIKRKESLKNLEDKRLAFAAKLAEMGLTCKQALYGQMSGGFHGLAFCGEDLYYLTGPGPMDEDDFSVRKVEKGQTTMELEPVFVPAEGMGGFLGFGKKGGKGFRINLTFADETTGCVEVVAGQNCAMDVVKGKDPLFDTRRRKGYSNVVWDYKPMEIKQANAIEKRWTDLLAAYL